MAVSGEMLHGHGESLLIVAFFVNRLSAVVSKHWLRIQPAAAIVVNKKKITLAIEFTHFSADYRTSQRKQGVAVAILYTHSEQGVAILTVGLDRVWLSLSVYILTANDDNSCHFRAEITT